MIRSYIDITKKLFYLLIHIGNMERVETRYEVMHQQLYENHVTLVAKNKKLSSEKDVWVAKAIQAEKMAQYLQEHEREEAAKYHEEL